MKHRRLHLLAIFVALTLPALSICKLVIQLNADGLVERLPTETWASWTDTDYERECGCPGKVLCDDRASGGGYVKEWRDPDDFYMRVSFDKNGRQWFHESGTDHKPTLLKRIRNWLGL